MAGRLPTTILLALGAALGGADALRVLLELAGRSSYLDIAICVFAMCMVTAYLLGAVLVVRFVREARPAAGQHAAATDYFSQTTLMVSVCVEFLVAACLLIVPFVASGSGRPHVQSPMFLLAIAGTTLLVRFSRRARNGPGAAPRPATDTRRFGELTSLAVIVSTVACLLAILYAYAGEHARSG